MSLLRTVASTGAVVPKLDSSEVFSTYLYTGNGSTQTINNGIDLAGQGGMVWCKSRSISGGYHSIYDTIRGVTKPVYTNTTAVQDTVVAGLTAFNSDGFVLGSEPDVNRGNVGDTYASWTFRKAPKFFHQVLKVHVNGTASTVDLSTLGTVGMVTVKSTVNTGNWFTWHKDLTAGNNLKLNLTDAQSATNAYLSVSGTTLTIASTAPSDTYIVYSWAHDTSADGVIQCGSFTSTGGEDLVNLGWEAQFVLTKRVDIADNWKMQDIMRGMVAMPQSLGQPTVFPNLSNAEANNMYISPETNGFKVKQLANGGTFIYMAIRRPNKVPTSGTEVYNAIARTGTGATATVTGVGFAPDLVTVRARSAGYMNIFNDRLRGNGNFIYTASTTSEGTGTTSITSLDMSGMTLGTDSGTYVNNNTVPYINHFFKRAKGFFDIVCYTGTGVARTVNHNLGVAPELMIVKGRSAANSWYVYHTAIGNTAAIYLNLNLAVGSPNIGLWNNTTPSSSLFTLGTDDQVNGTSITQVAYLFSSLAGISKVGSYTGNGTSQTIACGFSTGARFILIKRTDLAGDWYIWDTVRGIVAGNDPHLSLNTTSAEVTTDDSIDPASSGFIVNQVAATNVNVSSATYIYLAIS